MNTIRTSAVICGAALFACASTRAFAELISVGPQVTVSDEILLGATLATGATGETLLAWQDDPNGDSDLFGRLYSADGVPGTDFVISTYTTGDQEIPVIAADGAGNFIVAWFDAGRDGDGSGVFGQRIDASGLPIGADFAVNSYTTGDQIVTDVAAAPDGRFVVAWGGEGGARMQSFDATATMTGSDVLVVPGAATYPRVVMDGGANFLASWRDAGGFVDFQRFAANGTPNGALVDNAAGRGGHDIAMMPDGRFVLVWTSGDVNVCDLTGRTYDAAGVALGPDFAVSTDPDARECVFPAVAYDGAGGFVIAWQHTGDRDGDGGAGIFAQRYDAAGVPDSANLRVNRVRTRMQAAPRVTIGPDGGATVMWTELFTYSYATGLSLARFCPDDSPTCDRCPGFDDSIDTDADGIPDGCDACTNVLGDQTMDEGVQVAVLHSDREVFWENDYYKGAVRAAGNFRMAGAPGAFATVDPSLDGASIRFAAPDGPMVMSAELVPGSYAGAGTRGWRLVDGGRKWIYRDKTGLGSVYPQFGILKAMIEDRSTPASPNLVRIAVKGKRGIYPMVEEDGVIDFAIVLGAQAASDAGLCGETSFSEADCTFVPGALDRKMRCKR